MLKINNVYKTFNANTVNEKKVELTDKQKGAISSVENTDKTTFEAPKGASNAVYYFITLIVHCQ